MWFFDWPVPSQKLVFVSPDIADFASLTFLIWWASVGFISRQIPLAANGIIFALGIACAGGAFSWGAPWRLDASGSLGELLLAFILEAVWVAFAVGIHHTAHTAAKCLFSAFRHIGYLTPAGYRSLLIAANGDFDITDFASLTILIWWAGVAAASPSCKRIEIKKKPCVRNRLLRIC